MGILDSIMGQMGGGGGIGGMVEQQVAAMIAQKMGLDPTMVQTAVGALMNNHTQPNDTVQAAAAQTGIAPDVMHQIMSHIGGEGALGALIGQIGGGAVPPAGGLPDGAPQGGNGIGDMLGGMMGNLMGGDKR